MKKKIIRVGKTYSEISNYRDYEVLVIYLNPSIKMDDEKKLKKLTSILWEAKENNGKVTTYSRDGNLVSFFEWTFDIFLTKY